MLGGKIMNTNDFQSHTSIRHKREKESFFSDNGLFFFFTFFVCYLIWLFATYSPVNNYFIGSQAEISRVLFLFFFSFLLSDFVYKLFWLRIRDNNIISYLCLPISKSILISDCILHNLAYYKNYLTAAAFIAFVVKMEMSCQFDISFGITLSFAFVLFGLVNSGLAYLIQNISKLSVLKYILSITIYIAGVVVALLNMDLLFLFNNMIFCVLVCTIAIIVYYFLTRKAIKQFIYNESEKRIYCRGNVIFKFNFFKQPLYKLIFRSKNLLANTMSIPLFIIYFAYVANSAKTEDDLNFANLLLFCIAAISPRWYSLQPMFSTCNDFLFTIQKNYYSKIIYDLYKFIIIIALLGAIFIFLFTNNVFYVFNYFFSSIGVVMIAYALFSVFDPDNKDMLTMGLISENLHSNMKPNLLLFLSLIFMGAIYYFGSLYIKREVFTLIVVVQGTIVFLTRNYWMNQICNIYMNRRYKNLAECRGDKFYK